MKQTKNTYSINTHQNARRILAASASAILFFLFFYALNLVSTGFDISIMKNAPIVNNWSYYNSHSMEEISKRKSTYSLLNLEKHNGGDFFVISTQLSPDKDPKNLLLQTYYNPVRVEINDRVVFDNLGTDAYFTKDFIKVPIPVSESNVNVTIKAYFAFQPEMQAFTAPSYYFGLPLTIGSLMSILILIFTISVCIRNIRRSRHRCANRCEDQLLPNGMTGLLFCVPLLVQALLLLLNISPPFFYLKVVLCLQFLAGLTSFSKMIRLHLFKNKKIRILVFLFGIYACTLLFIPFSLVFAWLIKFAHVFYLSLCLFFLFHLRHKYFKRGGLVNQLTLLSDILALLSLTAFWMSFLSIGTANLLIPVTLSLLLHTTMYSSFHQPNIKSICEKIHEIHDVMQFKPKELQPYDDIIEVFLQNSDNLTHVRNVSLYVYAICRSYLSPEEAEEVAKAAFLHDIGKTKIPARVLHKEKAYTEEDYKQIRQHAKYGYEMLSVRPEPFFQMAAKMAYLHHERYDGKGYYGFAPEEVDILAKITAIADVFDGLTTDRKYKTAWFFEESVDYVVQNSKSAFDPQAVEYFLQSYGLLYQVYCKIKSHSS